MVLDAQQCECVTLDDPTKLLAGQSRQGCPVADVVQAVERLDLLGAADYTLVAKGQRDLFSFCMCAGGMVIPNQDKLVYETLGDERNLDKIERLLPPPEEPMPPPEPAAPPAAVEPAPEAPATPAPEPVVVAPSVPVEEQAPIPAPKPVVQPPPAPTATAAPLAGFRIQLAALRSRADAEAAWRRLKRANGDLLGALEAEVARVDLADKGIFYRLRAGPLASAAKAGALCARLKSRKLECFVVKP